MTQLSDKHVSSQSTDGYIGLPVAAFRCVQLSGFDVFCSQTGRGAPTLLCSASRGFAERDLDELQSRGYETLLVRSEDFYGASQSLFDSLASISKNRSVSTREKFALLQTAVAAEIEGAFRMTESNRLVDLAREVGLQIAQMFEGEKVAPAEMYSLVQHDASTFAHVTNVAGYAVVLARELWSDLSSDDLEHIAVGAMLHDYGKKFIPTSLLAKPSRLSPGEREVVEKHPQLGYESLKRRGQLSRAQLMMVYQHHERINGTGYPVRILGDEIHPWAKMLAVVDVFDAMTGLRPYRDRTSANEALLYLADSAGDQFDPEFVLCWISIFHPQ